jgi:hypothetical protein
MLHAGLDLSRNRLDVCLPSGQGEIVEEFKSPAYLDGRDEAARDYERRLLAAFAEIHDGRRPFAYLSG